MRGEFERKYDILEPTLADVVNILLPYTKEKSRLN